MAPALMAMAKICAGRHAVGAPSPCAGGARPKGTGHPDCCPKARYQRPDYPGRRPVSERHSALSVGTWAKKRSKACWPPADAPTATITGVTALKLPNEFSNIEPGAQTKSEVAGSKPHFQYTPFLPMKIARRQNRGHPRYGADIRPVRTLSCERLCQSWVDAAVRTRACELNRLHASLPPH